MYFSRPLRALMALVPLTFACPAIAQDLLDSSYPPTVVIPPPAPIVTLIIPPPPSPEAIALPPPARALIEKAISSGDPQSVAAVIKLARAMYPQGAAQIDALQAENDARIAEKAAAAARARADQLANASLLENWKGEVEVGASQTTGNSESVGAYGSLKLNREGLKWRHSVSIRADYQRTEHVTTTERMNAQYQPNYKFDDKLYTYGIAQYEHDPILGYDGRYTLGGGIGYTVVKKPTISLSFEGGPAVRYTDFVDEDRQTALAGRASMAFKWQVRPTVTIQQDAAVYFDKGNNTANSTTSIDTKLIGALKARFSYNIQYEKNAPVGTDPVDTTSRATLLYSF
ncbi:DUF481 domain-containing protein [Flavisphingomonas formosensis]|uniref:DUF481 domain-containing protein n=1 Tax=Flavisphingomonas formosensis TaxID=861534 RepID=UPI0012F9907A|nr:DUF481 domain-containing protein [Sphingomonas formosensis]